MQGERPHYTKEEAGRIFRRALKGGGSFTISKHCKERMRERGIDINDLKALALCGVVYDPPEPHLRTGEWIYRIETPDRGLKVVFAIAGDVVRLITAEN